MELVLDADGLIKLNRAGVLRHVVDTYSCAVPQPVYDEVVTRGKARLHRDAEAIEAILADRVQIVPAGEHRQSEVGLGAGETAILSILTEGSGALVVSDDRRFLTVLSREGAPFLTPADTLVVLARQGILTREQARGALERLRPAIRATAYWDARQDLESEGVSHEEE